nr:hypothetical protein [Lachnospiraceae bacterium]
VIATNSLDGSGSVSWLETNVNTEALNYEASTLGKKIKEDSSGNYSSDNAVAAITSSPDMVYFYARNFYNVNGFLNYMRTLFCECWAQKAGSIENVNGNMPTEEEFKDFYTKVIATGSDSGAVVIQDPSHWPVQLYIYEKKEGDSTQYQLLYNRWNMYFDAGISGLTQKPDAETIKTGIDGGVYDGVEALDAKFMAMVKDTTNYPDYSNKGDLPQGFVKLSEGGSSGGAVPAGTQEGYTIDLTTKLSFLETARNNLLSVSAVSGKNAMQADSELTDETKEKESKQQADSQDPTDEEKQTQSQDPTDEEKQTQSQDSTGEEKQTQSQDSTDEEKQTQSQDLTDEEKQTDSQESSNEEQQTDPHESSNEEQQTDPHESSNEEQQTDPQESSNEEQQTDPQESSNEEQQTDPQKSSNEEGTENLTDRSAEENPEDQNE